MGWFGNLKTAWKLGIGFGLVTVLTAVLGWQAERGLKALDESLNDLYETDVVGTLALKDANVDLIQISRAIATAILVDDPAAIQDRMKVIKDYEGRFIAHVDRFVQLARLEANKLRAQEILTRFRELRPQQDAAVQLSLEGKDDEAEARVKDIREKANAIEALVVELVSSKDQVMRDTLATANAMYASLRSRILAAVALVMLFAVGIGTVVTRFVVRSLRAVMAVTTRAAGGELDARARLTSRDELGEMGRSLDGFLDVLQDALRSVMDVAEQAAGGDLTRRIDLDRSDEIGRMAQALNRFLDTLHDGMSQVAESSAALAGASEQLSAGSAQLASGAQQQASSLEECAASLEEMSATIKQSADNARQASQVAAASRDTAASGGQVVSQAVGAMTEISQAALRIADIITAIDEIAFQTNLLALNAAVEAARAGEQGRGFAVVAGEVRNLAQRSATAAKEIKALIKESVAKIETGADLVNRSGDSLGDIVQAVKRVTDFIDEIAAASGEQSSGIDQVTKAVADMDKVTQLNAAQTEELSSTAGALAAQAEQLQQLVARFRLQEIGASRPVRRARDVQAQARRAPVAAAPTPSQPAPGPHEPEPGFHAF